MGGTIDFKRPDGQTVSGYLAEPGIAGAPGIVVIQEWWGLNDQIRGVAERLAGAGYRVLVPDLYRGKSTVEAEEAHHLMTALDFGDAAAQDLRGAVQALKAQGCPKVGVTGFCMGGALTLLAATMAPEARCRRGLVRLPAAGVRRRHQDRRAADGALGDAGRRLRDRRCRHARGQAEGGRRRVTPAIATWRTMVSPTKRRRAPGRIPMTQYDAAWAQLAWDRTLRFFGATVG